MTTNFSTEIKNCEIFIEEFENKLQKGEFVEKKLLKNLDRKVQELSQIIKLEAPDDEALKDNQIIFIKNLEVLHQRIEKALSLFKTRKLKFFHQLPSVSSRLLFQIHADEFGGDSQLAGMKTVEPLTYVNDYFQKRRSEDYSNYGLSDDILDSMKNAASIQGDSTSRYVVNAQNLITQCFKDNKSVLLIGGWTANPSGHAMYYEIIPTGKGKANVRIYNLGAGAVKDDSGVISGHKNPVYCELIGVTEEKLKNPNFLMAIKEMTTYPMKPETGEPTYYNHKEIYGMFKDHLQPEKIISSPLLMHLQYGDTCTWRSLLAYMRPHMSIENYKRFKCDMMLQTLVDFVNNSSYPDIVSWRLVDKSFHKLSRKLERAKEEKYIDSNYISKAISALEPVENWIKVHKNLQIDNPPEIRTYEPSSKLNASFIDRLNVPLYKQAEGNVVETLQQPCTYLYDQLQSYLNMPPEELISKLGEVKEIFQKGWKEGEDFALNSAFLDIVRNIPMEKSFWEKICDGDPEKAKNLIIQLHDISYAFFKSCYTVPNAHLVYPEKIQSMLKILCIQELLVKLAEPELFEDFALDYGCFHNDGIDKLYGLTYLFYRLYEPQNQRDLASIKPWVRRDFSEIKKHNGPLSVDLKKSMSQSKMMGGHNKKDIVALLQNFTPNLRALCRKENPNFYYLEPEEQEMFMYASPHLPDWFRAMRDSNVYFSFLSTGYVGNLIKVDRENDLKLSYTVEKSGEFRGIRFLCYKLNGVNEDIVVPEILDQFKRDKFFGRFTPLIRPFRDTSLQNLVQEASSFYKSRFMSEKNLLGSDLKKIEAEKLVKIPSEEDYQELARLFLDDKIQILEALVYFTKHPEKLKDPDYQQIFQMAFFSKDLLLNEFKIEGFAEKIHTFLENTFNQFQEENLIQPSVFLLQMSSQFEKFTPQKNLFMDTHKHLHNLLDKDKALEAKEKSVIFAELIASLKSKKSLSQEECLEILKGYAYLQKNPIPKEWTDVYLEYDIKKCLQIHSKELKEFLNPVGKINEQALSQILSVVNYKDSMEGWTVIDKEGSFPIFCSKDKKCTYFPLKGEIIASVSNQRLPADILQHPYFLRLFPEIQDGKHIAGSLFSFNDKFGHEILVALQGSELIIEQKGLMGPQDDSWYRFIPQQAFIEEKIEQQNLNVNVPLTKESLSEKNETKILSPLICRSLAQDYTHWQSLKNPAQIAIVKSSDNDAVSYRVKVHNDRVTKIIRMSDKAQLKKSSTPLARFEDPSYIEEWYNSEGNLIEINLPRYKLSFKPTLENRNVLACDQIPGFFIKNSNEVVKALGIHRNYLVLENEEGTQKKILIPYLNFKESKKSESLLPNFEIDQLLARGNVEPQKYFIYDVLQEDKLSSASQEVNLYLANVLLATQKYKKSALYLKNYGEKLSSYNEEEKQILKQMCLNSSITKDVNGNSLALQTYAGYLLLKNDHEQKSGSFPAMVSYITTKNYLNYLKHFRQATIFKLDLTEELFLIRQLLQMSHSSFLEKEIPNYQILLKDRLRQLSPEEAKLIQLEDVPAHEKQVDVEKLFGVFTFPEYNADPLVSPTLITKPHEMIKKSFHRIFNLAQNGAEDQKEMVAFALSFLKYSSDDKDVALGMILESVLKNPQEFPSVPNVKSKWDSALRDWEKEVIPKVVKLNSVKNKIQEATQQDKPKVVNITSSYAKFDHKEPERPEVSAKLHFEPLTASFSENFKNFFKIQDTTQQNEAHRIRLQSIKKEMDAWKKLTSQDKIELDRLTDGVEAFEKQPLPAKYALIGSLQDIEKNLNANKKENKQTLKDLEKHILTLANHFSLDPVKQKEEKLLKWGGHRDNFKLDDLIVNFARQEPDLLLQQNPALNLEEINIIYSHLGAYLLLKTQEQQRARAQVAFDKLKKLTPKTEEDVNKIYDFTQQLAETLFAKRVYDPVTNPTYLVFEYYADIIMRENQVDKLKIFLEGKTPNPVLEMIMGSGKSKVLLPLLGLLRAKNDQLSMLIVPQSLFASVASDTLRIFKRFSKSLRTLHFNRNTQFTAHSLQTILDDLNKIQKKKECLIMTSKSVECLTLKFIEKCTEFLQGKKMTDFPLEIKLMRQIMSKLRHQGYPIIDEADSILNVLYEVCFSIGEKGSPDPEEKILISEIYQLLYTDKDLKELMRLESDPEPNLKAPILTSKVYFDSIQKILAEKLILKMQTINFESPALTKKMGNYIAKVLKDPKEKDLLTSYMCHNKDKLEQARTFYEKQSPEIKKFLISLEKQGKLTNLSIQDMMAILKADPGKDFSDVEKQNITAFCKHLETHPDDQTILNNAILQDEAQSYYDKLDDPEIQNIIALSGEELSNLLKHTLCANFDENYGIDKDSSQVIAIPFSGATTPNRGSEFANPHVTMNYTFQSYIKKGISMDLLKKEIEKLQKEARSEIIKEKIPLKKTKAWDKFIRLKGNVDISFFSPKDYQLQELLYVINKDVSSKCIFVKDIILPQIEIFKNKLSCNPINLSSLYKYVAAFTGALWNSSSMSSQLNPIPEPGTDAKTISLLWDNAPVYFIDEDSTENMLKQLQEQGITFELLSDSGGYFKKILNLENARKMAIFYNKPVAFYNAQGEQTITDGYKEMPLNQSKIPESERLTFLDQIHTTGADILQKKRAVGIVTVGRNMLLRDLLQSAWRLRELDKSQKVAFVISKEVEGLIRQFVNKKENEKILFQDILRFTINNQSERIKKDNLKAFKQELLNLPQQILLLALDHEALTPEEYNKAFEKLQSTWIKPAHKTAAESYGKIAIEQKKEVFLDFEKKQITQFLQKLFEELPFLEEKKVASLSASQQRVEEIIQRAMNQLPDFLSTKEGDEDLVVELVQETETETELESQQAKESGNINLGCCFAARNIKKGVLKEDVLKEVHELNDDLLKEQKQLPYFSLELYLKQDKDLKEYAEAFEGIYLTLNVLEWPRQIPFATLLKFLGTHRTPLENVLIEKDKIILLNQDDSASLKTDPNFYNLTTGYYSPKKSVSPDMQAKLVKIKFLNGYSNFENPDDVAYLKKWLIKQGPEKMYRLFREKIIAGYPNKSITYENSQLKDLFKELLLSVA